MVVEFETETMSTESRNRSGPRIEPWGTPEVTTATGEKTPSRVCLSVRYSQQTSCTEIQSHPLASETAWERIEGFRNVDKDTGHAVPILQGQVPS